MSLSYELKDIANLDDKRTHPADAGRMHPIMEKMIWATMTTSIGTITAANAEEFYWRYAFARRLDRQPDAAFGTGEEVFITLDDVKDHIGLHTNATTILDRKKWLGRFANDQAYGVQQEGTGREMFDRIARVNMAAAQAKATALRPTA